MSERKSKSEREAEKRRARRARREQREQRRAAMMHGRSDTERRDHMAEIATRELKPNVGDLLTGADAVAELRRIEKATAADLAKGKS